jgi:glycosyltransferase involved in cell wall biosynthesis
VRVFYIDTGLANEVGHHATSCRLITGALRERGHDVVVAACKGIERPLQEELNARPTFRINTYTRCDEDPICGWLAAHFLVASATSDDLVALGQVAPEDLIYVNSVMPAQLSAVYDFLTRFPDGHRPQTVVELGTDPGVEYLASPSGITLAPRDPRSDARATLYRFTARQMAARPLPELQLITFDRTSSEVYSLLLAIPVGVLPLPNVAADAPHRRDGSNVRTIAFLGHQRGEKGYHLVPDITRLLLSSGHLVRLLVHNAQPDGMTGVQQAMRALAAVDPRVELDERSAGPEAWQALLRRSDVIVCPYLPDRFRAAYSAITAEAIAAGIPLVVPEHTTLSETVKELEAGGTTFAGHEAASVAAAVTRLLERFEWHANRSAAAADRWSKTMGAGRMVEAMLARIAAAVMEQRIVCHAEAMDPSP